jgi:hypothetical protein
MSGNRDNLQKIQELERLVEQTRKRVDQLIADGMKHAKTGQISSMERSVTNIQIFIKNPKLPRDLIHEAQRAIVDMEKEGYIFYIDDLLVKARDAAQDQRLKQKHAIIMMVKEYLPKAMKAGASDDFRHSVDRRIELIELTGNPTAPESGSRAKPIDKLRSLLPNRAKLFGGDDNGT